MKNTLKLLTVFVLVVSMLCACGAASSAPKIELNDEEKEMLEMLGSDVNVVASADFANTVAGFTTDDSGKLFQLTGYFQAAPEGAENPSLADAKSDPKVAIDVRYLLKELTAGEQYTITGVVTVEEHDGHAHMTLDALAVESYTAE